jgi:hypothetical protein
LNKLFLSRNKYYRHLDRQATLFDDPVEEARNSNSVHIEHQIKVEWENLDFQYGGVAFSYQDPATNHTLSFEIEHDTIRPEFEVLKPYFSKLIGSKHIIINIYAEFENNIVVSQQAICPDLEKIGRETIESAKFRIIDEAFINGKSIPDNSTNLLSLAQMQEKTFAKSLFKSEKELLEKILTESTFKHFLHIRYLADLHLGAVCKIRFVLRPFSFLFLLAGNEQWHIILETLDTEEATYIWRFDKDREQLPEFLKVINEDLTTIRIKGRQTFLGDAPKNFSRIMHNYLEERKGFIQWRDLLEEQLY